MHCHVNGILRSRTKTEVFLLLSNYSTVVAGFLLYCKKLKYCFPFVFLPQHIVQLVVTCLFTNPLWFLPFQPLIFHVWGVLIWDLLFFVPPASVSFIILVFRVFGFNFSPQSHLLSPSFPFYCPSFLWLYKDPSSTLHTWSCITYISPQEFCVKCPVGLTDTHKGTWNSHGRWIPMIEQTNCSTQHNAHK